MPILDTSLNIAVARTVDARETVGVVAVRADAAPRAVADRAGPFTFALRATFDAPRAAFDTIKPCVDSRTFDARTSGRVTAVRETESLERAFCVVDEPRGFGAWTASTSSAPHTVAIAIKERKNLIRLNTKIHLSVVCILSFFWGMNQAHFATSLK